jgi:membrane-bound metal-dependent hydrolase YbcI (DUF457 family)
MLAVMFGSIAPDIDIKQSMVRKWYVVLPTLPFWIAQLGIYWILGSIYGFKHRGVMHSLIGWAASFGAIGALTDVMFGRMISMAVCAGFAFGYLAHLIEDAITTKTRIDWIPEPKFLKSWAVMGIALVMLIVPVVSAADGDITSKSFAEVQTEFNDFAATVFWFGVKVVVVYAGIMSYCGLTHKSVNIVKGLILAFLIVFVLTGILTSIFT